MERWKEYIGDLFDDNRPEMPKMENKEGPPILKSEVEKALHKMKNGKALGEDQISAEMLKALYDFGIEKLTILFTSGCLRHLLLYRKKTKAIDCGDFRTLNLMSHITKLLLRVIQERI